MRELLGKQLKVVQVHNAPIYRGGGEIVFESTIRLLKSHGTEVISLTRSNDGLSKSNSLKVRAFCNGIYSISAYKSMIRLVTHETPDLIHVHNLYPFFSPSILVACRRAGIPTVLTCHEYRLNCPTGFHLCKGQICEMCTPGKEYWCILKNCRGNFLESLGYGLRSATARKFRLFHKNVGFIIAISDFLKRRLLQVGFLEDRISVVPNSVPVPHFKIKTTSGEYIAFVGRISPEKGVDTLLTAAGKRPELPIRIAGDGPLMPRIIQSAPKNVIFVGLLNRPEIAKFYGQARFLVVPSIWYEPFGLVAVEAMSRGLPVIASRIGGLPEIVDDGVTGVLFEPGNPQDLATKMKMLWENRELCERMGKAGREKVIREYSEEVYYGRLMAVYQKAISLNNGETHS